jgi:hypothetical protein
MPATYSGNPGESNKDEVRFLIGDVGGSTHDESNEFFLKDEEIRFALENQTSTKAAALYCAKGIKRRLSREVDAHVGDGSVSFSQRFENIDEIITELESDVDLEGIDPYAGGISESDKDNAEADTDRVDPFFTREQFDNTRSFDAQSADRTKDAEDFDWGN